MRQLPSGRSRGVGRVTSVVAVSLALLLGSVGGRAFAESGQSGDSLTGALVGRVTDVDGKPLSGVGVGIYEWDAPTGSWGQNSVTTRTTTDDGTFEVPGLTPGRYTAVYSGPYRSGYLSTWRGRTLVKEDAQAFEIDADHSSVDGSIELILGGSISGRITGTGGEGLAKARVELSQNGIGGGTWISTDDHGAYSAVGVYPGRYLVNFKGQWGSSWIDTWWEDGADQSEANELEIQPGTVLNGIDAQLAEPSTISGRLVDAECSQPVSGLSVEAWRLQRDGTWTPAGERKSDSAGRFTIYRLRAGTYRLEVIHPFYDDRGFLNHWWDRVTEESQAKVINVGSEDQVELGDMAMLKQTPKGYWNHDGSYWTLNGAYPSVGSTLIASACSGPVYPPEAVFHWSIDGVPVAGVSGNSYVVEPADLGTRISAWVEFTGPGFAPQTRDLGQSLVVGRGMLTAPQGMRLGGTPATEGESLYLVSQDEWSPTPTQIAYQWRRDGEVLDGQTLSAHQVSKDDYGSRLSLVVTADRPGYETVEKTLDAGTVCYPDAAIPAASVQGIRSAGSILSVSGGSSATKMATAYEWRADGQLLVGETSSKVLLTRQLVGKTVVPTVVGSLSGCPGVSRSVSGVVPKTALAAKPRVTGKTRVGATLRLNRGTWTSGTTFSYRWYAAGKPIAGATKSSLKLGKSLRGKAVTVAVTGKKRGYATVTVTSTPGAKVH